MIDEPVQTNAQQKAMEKNIWNILEHLGIFRNTRPCPAFGRDGPRIRRSNLLEV